VNDGEVGSRIGEWAVGFKDITAPTNIRTMIASFIPRSAVGNKFPLILQSDGKPLHVQTACLLLASLNSIVLDFILRQKIAGQTLNFFIVEQLPILPPETFDRKMGGIELCGWIARQVLELTYVSEDMRPFAESMEYAGDPFAWDEERRRHLMVRLDALFFHLYGIGKKDAAYILDTFPIVRRHDEKQFGRYRTKDMILAYMNAVNAGDLDAVLDA